MCPPDGRGKSRHGLLLVTAVVVLLGSFIAGLAPAASAASRTAASANPATVSLAAVAVVCTSKSHPAVAAAMARDIQAAQGAGSAQVPDQH
jgi:hypothetical protein